MKKLKIIAALLLTMSTITTIGCSTEKVSNLGDKYANAKFDHTIEAKELGDVDDRIIKGNNSLAFRYLKEMIDTNASVVISPLSLTASLAYLQNGAEDETKEEILHVLGLSGVEASVINNSFKEIIGHLNSASGVEIKIGNSVWADNGTKVKDEFKNLGRSFYEADVEEVDFSKKYSGEMLNNWVLKQTAGKLISGYGTRALPSRMKMIVFSTVFFKGKWETPFSKIESDSGQYSGSRSIKMNQTLEVEYLDGDNFTAVRLPYEDVNYGMYIFLPDYNVSVNNLIKDMSNENWVNWVKKFTKTQISITIPRFGMGHGVALGGILKSFGMNSAFDRAANFSNISERHSLFPNSFNQQSSISINEHGTGVEVGALENKKDISEVIGETVIFNVNRPFAYAVVDKKTGLIMIIGKFDVN